MYIGFFSTPPYSKELEYDGYVSKMNHLKVIKATAH